MEAARKRRKWDVAAPDGMPLTGNRAAAVRGTPAVPAATAFPQPGADLRSSQSIDQATIARAQQGAQAIVERINAELRAKGQMPPVRGQSRFHDDSKDISREVHINDAPPPIRYNLTKRSVQDDIQRRTNTIVVIKGRYQALGTPGDDPEGHLRLRIMPGNVGPDDMIKQRAVDAGALEVRRLLQGGSMSRNAPPVSSIPPPDQMPGFGSVGGQLLQAPDQMQQAMHTQHGQFAHQTGSAQQPPELAQTVALYVGVDAPPHFNLHQRLTGPGDSYLQHISSTTGATVTLRGRGSGGMYDSPDHLHFFVSATNSKSFEEAKGLCVNLIDTVRAEHSKMFPPQTPMVSQPPTQAQSHAPAHLVNRQEGNQAPGGPAAGSYQQALPYSQPAHSQTYQPHQLGQSPDVPSVPHYSQASHYPPTSTYTAPSSYPPSMPTSMPASSYPQSMPTSMPASAYPSSAAFRPPGGPTGPSAHPQGSAPQGQSGSPHGQAGPVQRQAGPFQGQGPAFQSQHDPSCPSLPGQSAGPYGHAMPGQSPAQQPYPQYGQQAAPFARPQTPALGPMGQNGGPGHEQQPGMHSQQQQQPVYNMPGAYPQTQPEYGPQRPSNPDLSRVGMPGPGQGQGQNGAARPQQGMSNQDMAQQAERKRRFSEQKKETQWQQGMTQQPSMPSYGQRPDGSQQQGPPPAVESDVPPLPMGPPPPRPPVQFRMGSMGPPPPKMHPGAHVQSHPPVQGLVPYGDDD
ncbi:hypothetical protein WJX82_010794 [Trebouxia sp. C0006]